MHHLIEPVDQLCRVCGVEAKLSRSDKTPVFSRYYCSLSCRIVEHYELTLVSGIALLVIGIWSPVVLPVALIVLLFGWFGIKNRKRRSNKSTQN